MFDLLERISQWRGGLCSDLWWGHAVCVTCVRDWDENGKVNVVPEDDVIKEVAQDYYPGSGASNAEPIVID